MAWLRLPGWERPFMEDSLPIHHPGKRPLCLIHERETEEEGKGRWRKMWLNGGMAGMAKEKAWRHFSGI